MSVPPPPAPGQRIGPYLLEAPLGRGGMATVFRALDTKLQRRVALKLLHADLTYSEQSRKRFLREAQAAARLRHPNLVEIHDADEADGVPYIVMEYIEGRPLNEAPLDLRGKTAQLRKIAEAIHYAHRQGVIHRDIKPANLLVDSQGEPHVVDFGLAHLLDSRTRLTRTGSQIGTPAYMAPEQVAGRVDQIGERTDVYGLGAVLYEIIAGHPPHLAETVAEIFSRILSEDPPPPSKFSPDLPRDLETICLKALAREPLRRYATAGEFAEDLRRWQEAEPILARPASVVYRLRRQLFRRRTAVAAILAGAAVACAAVAIVVPKMRDLAAAREREEKLRELGKHWNRIVFAKTDLHRGQIEPGRGRAELAAAVDDVPADTAQGWYIRARGRFYLNDLRGAEEDLLRSVAMEPALDPAWALLARVRLERHRRAQYGVDSELPGDETSALLAPVVEALSRVQSRSGWMEKWGLLRTREDDVAETLAQAMIQARLENDEEGAFRLLAGAVQDYKSEEYYALLGILSATYEERRGWLDKAVEVMPGFGKAYLDRGMARASLRDIDGALADFGKAVELLPGDALAHAARGAIRERARDYEGALADANRAVDLDPDLLYVFYNRGVAHSRLGRDDEAIADYTRQIERSPRHRNSYFKRGIAKARMGDEEACVSDLLKAIEIDPRDAEAYYNLGVSYAGLQKFEDAEECYSRAIGLDPRHYRALANRGMIRLHLGKRKGANEDFEAALQYAPADWPARAQVEELVRDE